MLLIMKKFIVLFLITLCIPAAFSAVTNDIPTKIKTQQQTEVAEIDSMGAFDTLKVAPNEVVDFILSEDLDSLANSWLVNNALGLVDSTSDLDISLSTTIENTEISSPFSTQNISDSIFMERLKALNSAIDLSYNPTVRNTIEFYAERRRQKTEIMLGLSEYYMPMIEEIFDKYGIPLELKYMAVIESALNPRAVSRAGATGMWQFMYGTGKLYKLEVNSFIDERRDPVKSTEAAARYLKELYRIYGDWHLVIAAYNCGPGNINKAIKRAGNKRDYWSVYYLLPKETRGYVPAFIAAAYILNYHQLHNYQPKTPNFNLSTDTVMVSSYINFQQLSDKLGLDITMLRELNPIFKRDIIPATTTKQYSLVLPTYAIDKYIGMETEILAHKREQYFPNNQIKNPEPITATKKVSTPPTDIKGKDKIFYTVQMGDNVGFIADWFNIKLTDLRYWNNLSGNKIKATQKLVIYVPSGKGDYYSKFNNMSFAEKQKAAGASTEVAVVNETKPATEPDTKATQTTTVTEKPEITGSAYHYYTVKKGDNLWGIAKNFPGVTAESIQKLNGISNTRGLSVGQQLKIMKN